MQIITSKENSLIKHIIKLKNKKYREKYDEYLIEGAKIVKEAIEEKANIENIIVNEEAIESELLKKYLKQIEYIKVSNKLFKLISDVDNPQGIIAIIKKQINKNEIDYSKEIILALDNIQDPGNLGTIIRTADSIGLTQILVSKGTADSYNPKVIRSTMGAIFRVNIIECENLALKLQEAKTNKFKILATDLGSNKSIYDFNLNKTAIVIGNEANGVSKEILKIVDEKAIIPMLGKTESLNASIATAIILYEYVRQTLNK